METGSGFERLLMAEIATIQEFPLNLQVYIRGGTFRGVSAKSRNLAPTMAKPIVLVVCVWLILPDSESCSDEKLLGDFSDRDLVPLLLIVCVIKLHRRPPGMLPGSPKRLCKVWVDHGDEISLEYAGTHALKRDLVRMQWIL